MSAHSFESRGPSAAGAEDRHEHTVDDSRDLYAVANEAVVDTRVPAAESCADQANEAVDSLVPGGSFLLVADHDPRAIHYMLQAERPGSTTWDLLEDGPQRWQARIGKVTPQPRPAG